MGVRQSLDCCKGDEGSTPGFGFDGNPLSSLSRSCRRSHRTSYRSYLSHEDLNPDLSAYSGIMAHIMNSNKKRKGKKKKENANSTISELPGIKITSPGGTCREPEVDMNSNVIKTPHKDSTIAQSLRRRTKKNAKQSKDTPDTVRFDIPATSPISNTSIDNEKNSSGHFSQSTKTTDLSATTQDEKEAEHLLEWPSDDDSLLGLDSPAKTESGIGSPEGHPSGDGTDLEVHRDSLNRSLCSPCVYLAPSPSSSMYDMFDKDEEDSEEIGVIDELRRNFQSCVQKFTGQNAIADGMSGQSWTYTELGMDVQRVTDGLKKAGLGPGLRLVLIGPNSPQAVLTILATLALGATLVIISHTDPSEKILSKMRKVKPIIVVTSTCCQSSVLWAAGCCTSVKRSYEIGGLSGKCYPFTRLLDDSGTAEVEVFRTRHDGVALIVFSHDLHDRGYLRKFTFGSILSRLLTTDHNKDLRYEGIMNHVVLLALPLTEPFTLMNLLFSGFTQGHRIVTLPHWESRRALKVCQQYKVTYLPLSTLWYSYVTKLVSMRKTVRVPEVVVVYGSVPAIDLTQIPSLHRLGAKHVLLVYGMAETLGAIAVNHVTPTSTKAFELLKNIHIKIMSPEGEEVDCSVKGHVHVVCKDMCSHVSPTRKLRFKNEDNGCEWVETGDIGYLDVDNKLYIVAHENDKLVKEENEIWLCDLEHALRRSPCIADAAILAMDKVMAIVILRPGFRDVSAIDVIKMAAAAQSPNENDETNINIEDVQFTSAIPRSGNGRLMRETLRQQISQMLTCSVPWTTI